MLDVCLCGTGGTMPLKNRHLASALFRFNGHSLLTDCGEGTQIALKEAGFTFKPIDIICFTHFHADHISGLPGLLLTMGNEGREEPLIIAGPAGVQKIVNSLRIIAPGLPFEIEFIELSDSCESFDIYGMHITAFKVCHNLPCYGYRIDISRIGKFDSEKAMELGLPVTMWGRLQKGETIHSDGRTFTPDMVLGPPRRGLSVTYCTDSRPCDIIAEKAKDSDLFICEGMFGDDEKAERAAQTGHMLMSEAAQIAKIAEVGKLVLTHFSPSLQNPRDYKEAVRQIFPNTKMGYDGLIITLNFED